VRYWSRHWSRRVAPLAVLASLFALLASALAGCGARRGCWASATICSGSRALSGGQRQRVTLAVDLAKLHLFDPATTHRFV